jgi:hypothetical protein
MKITQAPAPAYFSLDWSDLQTLIGAGPDTISEVSVDSMGFVVLKIEADKVEAVKDSIYRKLNIFGPDLPKDMYRTSWIQEVSDVYRDSTCKIAAIKKIRDLSKCGLADGKNWVEHWFNRDGKFVAPFPPTPF